MTLQVEVERIEIGEPENLGNMALCDINYLFFLVDWGSVALRGWDGCVGGWWLVAHVRVLEKEAGLRAQL